MEKDQVISAQMIRYLLVMRRLGREKGAARCVDIAQALCVSRPSVHSMMKRMEGCGFIECGTSRSYALSAQGREAAAQYEKGYLTVSRRLCDYLPDSRTEFYASTALLAELTWGEIKKMCRRGGETTKADPAPGT